MRAYNYVVQLTVPEGFLEQADAVARSYGYNGAGQVVVPGYCREQNIDGTLYYSTVFYGNSPTGAPHPEVLVHIGSRDA